MKAYKSKGMKAPRPGAYKQDEDAQSDAPKTKPSMQHKEPSMKMEAGMQSMAPDHKKKALPTKDAPLGVTPGVNMGKSHELPKGGGVGESEV
jgi:hypothetical protein